jgi:hypothetical protein
LGAKKTWTYGRRKRDVHPKVVETVVVVVVVVGGRELGG